MKKKISVALGVAAVGLVTLASCGTNLPTTTPTPTTTAEPTTTVEPTVTSEVTPTTTEEVIPSTTEEEPEPEVLTPAEKILRNYIFTADGNEVKSLELPAIMTYAKKDYALTWTSDSENLVIPAEATSNKYVAAITRPEEGSVTVNLQVTLHYSDTETATADFTVRVAAIDVYDIADAYVFKQNKATVFKSFELDSATTLEGKYEATIAWESKTPEILTIEDGMAKFENQETRKEVNLSATFTYNGKSCTVPYKFTAYKERTPEELLSAFYDECGVYDEAFTVTGYVIAKAGYSASNENGNVYILDQTKGGAYYCYRSYCSQAVWDSLAIGTRVQITNCVATVYNGLIETKSSKDQKLSVITDDSVLAPLTAAELKEFKAGLNIEEYLLTKDEEKAADLVYQTGNLVSLKNWTVVSANSALTATAAGEIVTLEKDGVQIKVQLNKYGTDLKSDSKNPTGADKAVTAAKTFKAGDIVTVSGVLYYYNGWTIYACDDSTYTVDANLTAAKDAVTLKTAYVKPVTINLTDFKVPTGYTVAAAVEAESVKLTEGALVFTPGEEVEKVTILFTISDANGNSVKKEYTVSVGAVSPEEQVAYEKENTTIALTKPGKVTLGAVGSVFDDVAVTYEIVEAEGSDSATIDGNVLTVSSVDADVTITIKATFKNGDVTDTKDIVLNIKNAAVTTYEAATAVAEGTYKFGFYNSTLTDYYFFNGTVSGSYLGTTTDITAAVDVKVKAKDGKYTLSFVNSKNQTKYIAPIVSGTKVNLTVQDAAYEFDYNTELGTFAFTELEKNYIMSCSVANKTLGSTLVTAVTSVYYIPELYATKAETLTREEKLAKEADAIVIEDAFGGTAAVLPTSKYADDVTITYTVDGNATIDNGYIIYDLVTENKEITVTATLACGNKTKTKEIKVVVNAPEFKYVTEACAKELNLKNGDDICIKGVVTKKETNLCWISDGENEFEVYGTLNAKTKYVYTNLEVGKTIYIVAKYQLYGKTNETYAGAFIVDQTDTEADLKVKLTADELALANQDEDVKDKALDGNGTTYKDVTLTWSVKEESPYISIVDNKMTVTQPTDADVEVVVVCKVALGEVSQDVELKITIVKASDEKKASLSGTTKVTNSAIDETKNYAAEVGLDATIFDVKFAKNTASYPAAINTATSTATANVVLYNDKNNQKGSSVTVTIADGYEIESIVITWAYAIGTGTYPGTPSVDGTTKDVISETHTTDTITYDKGTKSFVIQNVGASGQVRIASIVITYKKVATE